MTLDLTDLGDASARRDIYGHENIANSGMRSRRLILSDRCIGTRSVREICSEPSYSNAVRENPL